MGDVKEDNKMQKQTHTFACDPLLLVTNKKFNFVFGDCSEIT